MHLQSSNQGFKFKVTGTSIEKNTYLMSLETPRQIHERYLKKVDRVRAILLFYLKSSIHIGPSSFLKKSHQETRLIWHFYIS